MKRASVPTLPASHLAKPAAQRRRASAGVAPIMVVQLVQTPHREKKVTETSARSGVETQPLQGSVHLPRLQRDSGPRLTFVDCTIQQIDEAIKTTNPGLQFNITAWQAILTGSPSASFKPFQNRSLSFWVKCFTKWQEVRKGNQDSINYFQLQEMMHSVSKPCVFQAIQLFDPEGWRRAHNDGMSALSLTNVQVSATEFMITGVMLSQVISTKHKLRFAFGLVDVDDSRDLDKEEFTTFVQAFVRGLATTFGVSSASLPNSNAIDELVCALFKRIGAAAARRVQRIYTNSGVDVKEAILKAVSARQEPASAASQCGEKLLEPCAPPKPRRQQLITYEVLLEWCCGDAFAQDPISTPFRLAIQRLCPRRHGDVADEFDDSLEKFFLSYKEPVPVPAEQKAVDTKDLLNRAEVLFIAKVVDYIREEDKLRLEVKDLDYIQKQHGICVSTRHKLAIVHALEMIAHLKRHNSTNRQQCGVSSGLFMELLRAVCPHAKSKHLRMFEAWREEGTTLSAQVSLLKDLEEANTEFLANDQKEFLPDIEIDALKREFHALDFLDCGSVTAHDIIKGWGWSYDLAQDTVAAFNIAGDGKLTYDEFLRMMCPEQYKLPSMNGFAREMFGQLLSAETACRRQSLEHDAAVFNDGESKHDGAVAKDAPRSVCKVVEQGVWTQWENVFWRLDRNSDGKVQPNELLASGLLAENICTAVIKLIPHDSECCITKTAFMEAMLKAHDRRAPTQFATNTSQRSH